MPTTRRATTARDTTATLQRATHINHTSSTSPQLDKWKVCGVSLVHAVACWGESRILHHAQRFCAAALVPLSLNTSIIAKAKSSPPRAAVGDSAILSMCNGDTGLAAVFEQLVQERAKDAHDKIVAQQYLAMHQQLAARNAAPTAVVTALNDIHAAEMKAVAAMAVAAGASVKTKLQEAYTQAATLSAAESEHVSRIAQLERELAAARAQGASEALAAAAYASAATIAATDAATAKLDASTARIESIAALARGQDIAMTTLAPQLQASAEVAVASRMKLLTASIETAEARAATEHKDRQLAELQRDVEAKLKAAQEAQAHAKTAEDAAQALVAAAKDAANAVSLAASEERAEAQRCSQEARAAARAAKEEAARLQEMAAEAQEQAEVAHAMARTARDETAAATQHATTMEAAATEATRARAEAEATALRAQTVAAQAQEATAVARAEAEAARQEVQARDMLLLAMVDTKTQLQAAKDAAAVATQQVEELATRVKVAEATASDEVMVLRQQVQAAEEARLVADKTCAVSRATLIRVRNELSGLGVQVRPSGKRARHE